MAERKYKYGFVGMGNMGFAILKGLLKSTDPSEVTFSSRSRDKMEDISARTGVYFQEDNYTCVNESKYVILAVKPQQMDHVIPEIRSAIGEDQIIVSIAPGLTIQMLKEKIGHPCRIVRAMPNTPALVGEGMTGVCYDAAELSEEEQITIEKFFSSFGKMVKVEEKLINAVVCVSGSSPAYVYMFIEALADAAVKYGMTRAAAYEMAAQAVLGSAKMVLETGKHPGELKDQVCSPGGTTIAAVSALEEHGLRNAVIKACDACYDKCSNIK